ncbi:hypothetical protein [Rickettsiella endosymbiont of Aleochara curtula]|jgi:succinate dehydrogenase/fumarate reductase flavoprotein subunit|uniref:hypothetical protein n=1 Tax=Rickettsiella endosymbiont of Aleochara curtula TaxID=3077936 RepID=UPI00313C9B82
MAGFLTFDTLQYVKKLREAGVAENIAEIQAEALKEVIETNIATKQDIRDLKRDIAALSVDLKRDIEMSKKDLTIRLGSMMVVAVSILSVLITLLK